MIIRVHARILFVSAATAASLKGEPVDFGRKFIPDELTPLSHTPAWHRLEPEHRLRYNQLQAFFFNEQIVFFETRIGSGLMQALLREGWPDDFRKSLRRLWHDELRHTDMFRRLNRHCAPYLYTDSDFHFRRVVQRSSSPPKMGPLKGHGRYRLRRASGRSAYS